MRSARHRASWRSAYGRPLGPPTASADRLTGVRFLLIRHGQSTNNLLYAEGRGPLSRDPDPGLTPLGERQAEQLARFAAEGGLSWLPSTIYSSLMLRAVQTAVPLARALGRPVIGHPTVHECGGPYEDIAGDGHRTPHPGSPRSVVAAVADPGGVPLELPDAIGEWGWYAGPYETSAAICARAADVVAGLRARHDDDDVIAVVTHGCFINFLLRTLLGIDAMTGWFAIHNASVTVVHDDVWELSQVTAGPLDWMPHLALDEVSD